MHTVNCKGHLPVWLVTHQAVGIFSVRRWLRLKRQKLGFAPPGESLIFKRPIWLLEQSPVGACLQREARVRRGSSKPCQCHPRRMPAVPVSELAILQLQPDEISDLFLGNQTTAFVHQICVLAIRNAPGLTPFVKKEGPSVSLHVLPRQAPQQPRRDILPPLLW